MLNGIGRNEDFAQRLDIIHVSDTSQLSSKLHFQSKDLKAYEINCESELNCNSVQFHVIL